MNSEEYIKVLEGANIPLIREFEHTFVHNNAPIHHSHSHNIPIEDWSQYSPGLNTIESFRGYIKKKLTLISEGELDFTNLKETVQKIWNEISPAFN